MSQLRRAALIAGPVGVLVASEFAHWRASHAHLPTPSTTGPSTTGPSTTGPGCSAVVVLGFRNRGSRANRTNRLRVRIGLRSATGPDPVLVLCGGPMGSDVPEADLLADEVRRAGFTGELRLDRTSRSTWHNITNAIPLLEDAATITIASNSTHAAQAREFLHRQRPDLAARLVRGRDYRFGEAPLIKLFALATARRTKAPS